MSPRIQPFKTPLFDPTGLGFGHWVAAWKYFRQRYIAGVSYNQSDDRIQAFNPDGLVLPLEHNRYALPKLLQGAVRHEFGRICGEGQFAIKAHEYRTLESAGRLKEWVTYWFSDPEGGFACEPTVRAVCRAKSVRQCREDIEVAFRSASDRVWPEHLRAGALKQSGLSDAESLSSSRQAWLASEIQRREEEAGEDSDRFYAQQLEFDRQISAWLRGDVGHPPLLALMKGAA